MPTRICANPHCESPSLGDDDLRIAGGYLDSPALCLTCWFNLDADTRTNILGTGSEAPDAR